MIKFITLFSIGLFSFLLSSCGETPHVTDDSPINYAQSFMGWDCPDNLQFPRIDLRDWQKVPVVNGRMPTYEEAQNGTALLHIDKDLRPDLKNVEPYNMILPKLAYFTNPRTKNKDVVIVIQLTQFKDYVWAGLRYVSGGNASEMMSNLKFLTDEDIKKELAKDTIIKTGVQINKAQGY